MVPLRRRALATSFSLAKANHHRGLAFFVLFGGSLALVAQGAPSQENAFVPLGGGRLELGLRAEEVSALVVECSRFETAESCRPERFASELSGERVVDVAPFALQRTEVSVLEYRRCERIGRCAPRTTVDEQGDLPVTRVTADDALAYCRSLGARLPSANELEFASRGSERRFFAGRHSTLSQPLANSGQAGPLETDGRDGFVERAPVNAMPEGATPEGILHLSGNVEEWTSSHEGEAEGNRAKQQIVMGGHFASPPLDLRATRRSLASPRESTRVRGFRCAR